MKNQIILFLLFLPLFVHSQKNKEHSFFTIGLNLSPDYCYRNIKAEGIAAEKYKDEFNAYEIPKFGFTTGINFTKQFNKIISVETGILFSDKGEKSDEMLLTTNLPIGPNLPPNIPVSVKYKSQYYYIEVPFKANIFLLNSKTKFYISTGFSINNFINHKSIYIIEYQNGRIEKEIINNKNNFNPRNYALIGGFGVSFDLSVKYFIRFEPTIRHSINPIMDDAIVDRYLYSAGINLGVSYKL